MSLKISEGFKFELGRVLAKFVISLTFILFIFLVIYFYGVR